MEIDRGPCKFSLTRYLLYHVASNGLCDMLQGHQQKTVLRPRRVEKSPVFSTMRNRDHAGDSFSQQIIILTLASMSHSSVNSYN